LGRIYGIKKDWATIKAAQLNKLKNKIFIENQLFIQSKLSYQHV
jgi:hypothetical protein